MTIQSNTAQSNTIQGLYLAYYGRPADTTGLTYWSSQLTASNDNVNVIINAFAHSAEANGRPSNTTNNQKINAVFQTLFNRDADANALAYYADMLTTGAATATDIAKRIMDGAQGADATIFTNKIAVAQAFSTAYNTQGDWTLFDVNKVDYIYDGFVNKQANVYNDAKIAVALIKGVNATTDLNALTTTFSNMNKTLSIAVATGTAGANSMSEEGLAGLYFAYNHKAANTQEMTALVTKVLEQKLNFSQVADYLAHTANALVEYPEFNKISFTTDEAKAFVSKVFNNTLNPYWLLGDKSYLGVDTSTSHETQQFITALAAGTATAQQTVANMVAEFNDWNGPTVYNDEFRELVHAAELNAAVNNDPSNKIALNFETDATNAIKAWGDTVMADPAKKAALLSTTQFNFNTTMMTLVDEQVSKYEAMLTPAQSAQIITDNEAMYINAQLIGIEHVHY